MLAALPLAFVGIVLLRTAFAPDPDPRKVLAGIFTGQGLQIGESSQQIYVDAMSWLPSSPAGRPPVSQPSYRTTPRTYR